MVKVLVDTNIWIDLFNKRDYAIDLVLKVAKKDQIYASILTITELRAGWTDEASSKFMPIFYSYTTIIDVSRQVAELAGKFIKDYQSKGISLATVDTLIGSTAVVEKCQLFTHNQKDFPMREIKFYQAEE